MSKKKIISIICATIVFSTAFAGCEKTDTGTAEITETTSASVAETVNSAVVQGQVTVVDDSSITVTVGEITEMSKPDNDGEMPEMPTDGADSGEKPEMPIDGADSGERPEMPNGDTPPQMNGNMGAMSVFTPNTTTSVISVDDNTTVQIEDMSGEITDGSISDISVNSIVEITTNDDGAADTIVIKKAVMSGNMGGGMNGGMDKGGFGGSGTVTNGTAANTINSDTTISNEAYSSTGDDENALRIDGAAVTLDGITADKSSGSSSNTEDGDFYGQNAAILALNGADVTITNANISSSAQNGNGVFSYGSGTTVTISDSTIRTTADNSGGIQTTGGGTTYANNLDVETQGNSSAAVRSDRGGGTVSVTGGKYASNGTGSPAVYSTADITVSDAELVANNSEAVVVEGKNSVKLSNCDVTGNMAGTYNDSSENIHNIMIYQSMSGDADVGKSHFEMLGGSLTALAGDMIYVTNTQCTIKLSEVVLNLFNDTILNVSGNSSSRGWGKEGSNGGDVEFIADNQKLTGNILVDEISTLTVSLENGTEFNGSINPDGQGGTVEVTIDNTSVWSLNADCYITTLENNGTINFNGFTIYLADGTAINS